jgi:hypothetical protein
MLSFKKLWHKSNTIFYFLVNIQYDFYHQFFRKVTSLLFYHQIKASFLTQKINSSSLFRIFAQNSFINTKSK